MIQFNRQCFVNRYALRGWIGFPIVLLSLAIASFTLVFYQKLSDMRHWNALQAPITADANYWGGFIQKIVYNADITKATPSVCYGFCPIKENTVWVYKATLDNGVQIQWNMNSFKFVESEGENKITFRICAQAVALVSLTKSSVPQYLDSPEIHCWWLNQVNDKFSIFGQMVFYIQPD
ncbi:hypothetical protein [Marinomonas sp. 2405UD68-3]|uniref:hypothetical protein n=1 Tax=Marinomonas sp. 2405UD68-3 TaxID=3391835 RepID=UPI0039C8C41F